jgi:hypothetical protein
MRDNDVLVRHIKPAARKIEALEKVVARDGIGIWPAADSS